MLKKIQKKVLWFRVDAQVQILQYAVPFEETMNSLIGGEQFANALHV